jgi:uncharacterized protein YpmB
MVSGISVIIIYVLFVGVRRSVTTEFREIMEVVSSWVEAIMEAEASVEADLAVAASAAAVPVRVSDGGHNVE